MSTAPWLFETARLQARGLGPGDEDALLAVYGDRDVVRWVGDGQPLDRDACTRWIAKTLNNVATRGYGMVALHLRGAAVPGGFAGIVHPTPDAPPEIKYAFLRGLWGQGLASEAAQGLLAWAAPRFGLREVIATTAPENTASHRVLAKAGFARGALRANADGSATQLFLWRAGAPKA